MLDSGISTGYAIKRAVDRSTRFFWAASLAQVYPELAALENGGYIVGTDAPRGARPRRVYRLTDKGREALQEWLRSERIAGLRADRAAGRTRARRFRLSEALEGADYFAWRAAWFRNLEAELAGEVPPTRRK